MHVVNCCCFPEDKSFTNLTLDTGWLNPHDRNSYEKSQEYIPDEKDLSLFYENPLAYEWELRNRLCVMNFYGKRYVNTPINREKETNGKVVTYLDRFQENYHDLFSKPLRKSGFTQIDIMMIEKELGYELP